MKNTLKHFLSKVIIRLSLRRDILYFIIRIKNVIIFFFKTCVYKNQLKKYFKRVWIECLKWRFTYFNISFK